MLQSPSGNKNTTISPDCESEEHDKPTNRQGRYGGEESADITSRGQHNSLSDVYAMGGVPITAMNIVCFPVKTMDMAVLKEILKGSIDKLQEAQVTLVGGHSVEDNEMKYGLSVTGTIHPNKVLRNTGARVGDKLILTKALGTGIINTALKGDMASVEAVTKAIDNMTTLNKTAAEILSDYDVSACTMCSLKS